MTAACQPDSQSLASTHQPNADGADGATEQPSCLFAGHPLEMAENDCGAAFLGESVDTLVQRGMELKVMLPRGEKLD